MRKPAAAFSLAMHVIAAIILFTITFPGAVPRIVPQAVHIFMPTLRPFKNDGGGGQRQPLPATRGRAPEVVARRVFVAPMVTRMETPKLVVLAALTEAPEYNISVPQVGDPLGAMGFPSGGPGGPVGIGDHGTDGIGNKNGPRQGGPHPPPVSVYTGKLTREPQLIYKEEPEYSDEARKARHEGTVLIDMDIDASGRPVNIRVIRGLGLGLDEKALAAVAHWKFRPAMAGDRAVAAPARVQVSFHLL
jgi:periplasmic protein TonB